MNRAQIEKIRSAVNIVDVVSSYVPDLRKAGDSYMGLCPFLSHKDSKPSFSVSESKQIYKCFGCQKGGNVFTFVMEYKGISFQQAVKEISELVGIPIGDEDPGNVEIMYQLNQYAAETWHNKLMQEYEESWVAKVRKVNEGTARQFMLGYCDGSFAEQIAGQLDDSIMETCGLFYRYGTKWVDAFAGRFIFPIWSYGRIVGFGGRSLTDKERPYKNSAETPIYHKSSVLYGLQQARGEIESTKFAILVEGYFDCLLLHQTGWKQTVAVCGANLTISHAKLLARHGRAALLAFDPDSAGIEATDKAFPPLFSLGMDVRVLRLPSGVDPDELAIADPSALQSMIFEAPAFMDGFDEKKLKNGERDEALWRARTIAAGISGTDERQAFIQSCSKRLGVAPKLLVGAKPAPSAAASLVAKVCQTKEGLLLACLLHDPSNKGDAFFETFRFENPFYQRLFELLKTWDGQDTAFLYDGLESEESDTLSALLTVALNPIGFAYATNMITAEFRARRVEALLKDLKVAEKEGKDVAGIKAELSKWL